MRIHVVTLGCPKNTVDTELMLGRLLEAGHQAVPEPATADAILINTCGFVESAKRESLDAIMEALEEKRRRPGLRVVAVGCLTQRYRDELARSIPELDGLLGVNDIPRVAATLAGKDTPPAVESPLYLPTADSPRQRVTPTHYAWVKVAEGCHRACTFCAIPGIRGPLRSRPLADLTAEIRALVADGVREINLVGQDTSAWGRDLDPPGDVAGLLDAAARAAGDAWVRLLYTYPTAVSPRLWAVMAAHPNICPYLDLPLQHSHPDILRAMGRPGDGAAYLDLLAEARRAVPGLWVRTAFIVGFPGERPHHFRHLLDFVAAARFDHLGVFTYSDEEGTPAATLPHKVGPAVAARRRDELMTRQQAIVAEIGRQRLGRVETVLVDGTAPGVAELIEARTMGQAPDIDGVVYLTAGPRGGLRPGDRVPARLTRCVGYDFTATVRRPPRPATLPAP